MKSQYDFTDCLAVDHRVGVRKDDKRGPDECHSSCHGGCLSLPFRLEVDGYFSVPVGLETVVCAVIASVRHPDDAEFVRRVVQGEAVLHLFVHHVFFVEGGDEEGYFRQITVRWQHPFHGFHEKLFQLDEGVEDDAVAQIGVEHHEQGEPEDDFEDESFVHSCILV